MVFKLFKSGDELYDEGKELIKRGEYAKARDYLQKSIDKEGGDDDSAAVKVALIDLKDRMGSADAYRNLLEKLKLLSTPDFEFGITRIDRDDLMTECDLTIKLIEAKAISGGSDQLKKKSELLQALAQEFRSKKGDKHMIVMELFRNNTSVTGNTEFFKLMAMSYECLSAAVVWDNPAQAAEYEQIAMGYHQQCGESGDDNLARSKDYSTTCTCWICGRIATGAGIHFFSAPADISPALDDSPDKAVKSMDPSGAHIYICRACYTAVSNRADDIAKGYHDVAMREMRAMEARLQAEIAALQSQITFARMSR